MSVAVRVAFVEDGTSAQIEAAAPYPSETLTSWTPIAAAPAAVPLPSPPSVTAWECAFADLAAAQVLYLAPGYGADDDPGVPVLQELKDRGAVSRTGVGACRQWTRRDGSGRQRLATVTGDADRGAGPRR